jgi:hypothetical protein
MRKEQTGDSGYSVEEEIGFYDSAKEKLENVIETTCNFTLLKKIYASGKFRQQVFDRITDLAFEKNNPEAMLEIIMICQQSKDKDKKMVNKMGAFVKNDNI